MLILGAMMLVASGPAYAHEDTGLAGGFVNGFLHPLSGLDHMLAMIAVGLWGAFLGRPLVYALPVIFPMMMAVGSAAGMAGAAIPPVELGIALSVLVLGALVLGAVRVPVAIACGIVGFFAVFHGYAHGVELPSTVDPSGYSLGFVVATGLLHLAGIALGSAQRLPWGKTIVRTLGGGVFLSGLWFLAGALL